jgi:nucleoside-diphosphate-sugar epimerase
MSGSIFVTGATGLLGANVCEVAIGQGRKVRALIRQKADEDLLRDIGVETVLGDIGDADALASQMEGIDAVFHSAGVVGGTWSTASNEDFMRINYQGTSNVMSAAQNAGVGRTIIVSSFVSFDSSKTITEISPVLPISGGGSIYTQSKRASFCDAMHRACLGFNVGFLIPGCIYGPSPNVGRALAETSFTRAMLRGIRGELTEYANFPLNWVYVLDVARIALGAIDDDEVGGRYLGVGRSEDEGSMAVFCNVAAEIAGSPHRVAEKSLADASSGLGAMAATAARSYATPIVDGKSTRENLGIPATSCHDGATATIDWLKKIGRLQW